MATFRSGYGLPARPSDGLRPRQASDGQSATRGAIPRPINRTAGNTAAIPRITEQLPASLSHAPSRLPQFSTSRNFTLSGSSSKAPPDNHPAKSPSGSSRTSSETSKSYNEGGAGSTSSSRSSEYTSKIAGPSLRRNKSSTARQAKATRQEPIRTGSSSSAKQQGNFSDCGLGNQDERANTESPAEIRVAEMVQIQRSHRLPPVIYPELDRYRNFQRPVDASAERLNGSMPLHLATHDLPSPTPASIPFSGRSSSQVSAVSASPSTKFSESPGPGPYSRDTTPTSMSSQSPVLVTPSRVNAAHRTARLHNIPTTRPPVTRRRANSFQNEVEKIATEPLGLAAVRESLTSSSSNSTVKDTDRVPKKAKLPDSRLPPPPPSPPPRRSSQKFRKRKDRDDIQLSSRTGTARGNDLPSAQDSTVGADTLSQTVTSSSAQNGPPARPSRQNTPDMKSQLFSPVPVIQSNLVSTGRSQERLGESESLFTPSLPGSTTSLPQTRRNFSTPNLSAGQRNTSQTAISRSATENSTETGRDATLARHGSLSRAKFAFFGRKRSTPSEDMKQEQKTTSKKLVRKGPVAGTGHEGYGRIGAVRRRSGNGTNLPRGAVDAFSSQDSLSSDDSFLTDRIKPVTISGGATVETRGRAKEVEEVVQNQVPTLPKFYTSSSLSLDGSSTSQNESGSPLQPSAMARGKQRDLYRSPRPSESSDSDVIIMKPTLAFRRSVQRLESTPDSPLRLPQPIRTTGHTLSPMTSFDTSIMSDESQHDLQRDAAQELRKMYHMPKKLQKKPRSGSPRRWNLFGRSQSQPRTKKRDGGEQLPATVTNVEAIEKRPVAFYAMLDSSEQEDYGPVDIQEVLKDADVYEQSSQLSSILTFTSATQSPANSSTAQLYQTPSGLGIDDAIDNTEKKTTASSSPRASNDLPRNVIRPSRLAQVGRIPQVVKKRPEKISPQSFSRPFRASLQLSSKKEPDVYDPESIATGPSPPRQPSPLPDLILEGSTAGSTTNFSSLRDSDLKVSPEVGRGDKEFLSFSPPRKNSAGTIFTSSSSSGGTNPFFGATAIIPKPDDPPAEDEVWGEYDDLLGDDGIKVPQSATSSKGVPFHLEAYQTQPITGRTSESPVIAGESRKASTYSKAPTHSSSYSADMTERIRLAFQPKPPIADETTCDTAEENGNTSEFRSHAQSKRDSTSSCHTVLSDSSSCSSNDGSPLALVNLRVGSMTVSKWLTFGHVLFSDIRHQLTPPHDDSKRHTILVIDGLGNDDWSFYAAETYPGASFFNLSPRAPLPKELNSTQSGFPLSPPNHHQIQYSCHLDKFPFASDSFDAVIYRFPAAASEVHHWNILSEAQRVLQPEGFIELSILDVDLNNMGNLGRRTIRRLKEQIHEKTPDTSLASTADLVVRLLGNSGFSNIRAARVGVPVASPITRSGSGRTKDRAAMDKKDDPPSLSEMMRDNSPAADENITKIVTRVGRWWYSRCYESAAASQVGKNIWTDKALISECEQLGTSLKLMVCCARAPGLTNTA